MTQLQIQTRTFYGAIKTPFMLNYLFPISASGLLKSLLYLIKKIEKAS
jgi:hypothetical protein